MIKAVVPALLIVTAITAPASAEGGFYDGNEFLELCQKQNGLTPLGYSVALVDVLNALAKICIPNGVKAGQVEDIVCGYLTKHPEKRHEAAHRLGADALIEAFPCNN